MMNNLYKDEKFKSLIISERKWDLWYLFLLEANV